MVTVVAMMRVPMLPTLAEILHPLKETNYEETLGRFADNAWQVVPDHLIALGVT